jgi:hypothetical protein
MNERKLTEEQINDLFEFCRKRKIKEYEIQIELVDHLATSIESQWEQHDDLSFSDALLQTQNDFGKKGFKTIVKSKNRMVRRKYNLLFFRYLLSFFKLPRIILTFSLTAILFIIIQRFDSNNFIERWLPSLNFLAIILMFFYFPKKLPKIREGISFLLINYFLQLRVTAIIVVQYFLTSRHYFEPYQSVWYDLLFSFLFVFVLIIEYTLLFYMPKLLKKDFIREFPQFVKS